MTWPEIQAAAERDVTILVPLGTTEAQNFHNPTGYDYFIAQRLSEAVAQRCEALITPIVPFGYSDIFSGYPGTITLQPATLKAIYFDVTRSLINSNFRHIVFINNHQPNQPILRYALADIRDAYGLVFPSIWPTALLREFGSELFEHASDRMVHGDEPGTSLMAYLYPELQRMDLAKRTSPTPDDFRNFSFADALNLAHKNQKIPFFLRFSDISDQGGWGSPQGDRAKGKMMFEELVAFVSSFVDRFKHTDNNVGNKKIR